MPVQHIVWVKFNDGVCEEKQKELLDAVSALESVIPGIKHFSIGKNFTERAKGFTHGFVVTLEDKDALMVYADHPEHVPVAMALRDHAELMALDFEF